MMKRYAMDFKTWFNENRMNPNWYRKLKTLDPEMFKTVDEWVEGVPGEKAFLFLTDTKIKPMCRCGSKVSWYPGKGYAKRCSPACSALETAMMRSKTLRDKPSSEKKKSQEMAHQTSIQKYGKDYASARANKRTRDILVKTEKARCEAMIAKYGVANPSFLESTHAKRRNTYASRTLDQRIATREKIMRTRILNGNSVPDNHPSILGTKKQYTRRVRYLTNKTVKELNLFEGRSITQHVDHLFSIADGFKYQVNPQVLAHPANLRTLPRSENSRKNAKSSISLSDLLRLVENDFE